MIRFLSLLLLVLVSTQISTANDLSAPAIEELRAQGPAGLQTLMTE